MASSVLSTTFLPITNRTTLRSLGGMRNTVFPQGRATSRRQSFPLHIVRCEGTSGGQPSSPGNTSLDIWLGRFAMLGFIGTLGVEVVTGKGLLQTAGLTAPAPTPALVVTAIVGIFTAFGVFRAASSD